MKDLSMYMITLLTALTLCSGSIFSQGLYWESTTKMPAGQMNDVVSSSSYRPQMFKQSSENGSMIFRLDRKMMYMVDNVKKEYTEMTFDQLEAYTKKASSQIENQVAELKKQMKNMPPEQRKALQEALEKQGMGDKPKTKISVTKTGETKTINGFSCVKYVLRQGKEETGNVWTTGAVAEYAKMKNEMQEFSKRLMEQIPMGKDLAEAMKKVEGFPIQTTISGVTSIVTKVEKKTPSASEFEVPVGYTKVEPQDMKQR
jgi:hypothetical protein